MKHGDQAFAGRVAVITGGASGIGFGVAEALAGKGCRLVLADIESSALDAATTKLAAKGADVIGVLTDVTSRDAVFALADAAWARFGAVHIVMHNAGVMVYGPTQKASHQDWLFNLNVNLWGPIYGVEAFAQRMIVQGEGGHHVFTASFAGLVPNLHFGPYNVSKAGVLALAESLRKDMRSTGIGVSVLCPMIVGTNIENSTRNRPQHLGGPAPNTITDEDRAHYGRILTTEAVARLVLDGIRDNRMYLHTHKEAESLVRARADRILSAFDHAL
jgi:NAD(P)-dependent dehydrogenase (short-subunit alcohol dehydrogenase family)